MRKTKQEKGITLIALIITIVVLLILAVVAIDSIQNDGIISHAGNTANTYNQAVENEQQHLDNYLSYLDKVQDEVNGDTKTYEIYKKGNKVQLKDTSKESGYFYVLTDSDETKHEVTLVTDRCINTEDLNNIKQSTNPTKMKFREENDWLPIEEWGVGDRSEYLYNSMKEPTSNHTAAYAAYKYGLRIGGYGRLLSQGEVEHISVEVSDKNNTSWTGTLYQDYNPEYNMESYVIPVAAWEMTIWYAGPASYSYNDTQYVRPVIEISKNLITLVE